MPGTAHGRARERSALARLVVPGMPAAPVAYTSDIPLLGRWGTPLLFGPGSIHVAHTPDEYIDVNELRSSVDTYAHLVRTLLAT